MSKKRSDAESPGGEKRGVAKNTKGPASPDLSAPQEIAYPSVAPHELNRLLSFKHADPHSILGIHPHAMGVIVRAYRPDAERVELLIGRERPRPMVKSHSTGLFELFVAD